MHICFLIKKKRGTGNESKRINGKDKNIFAIKNLRYAHSSVNYVETDLLIPVNKQLIRT